MRFDCGRQARPLKASLRDGFRTEDIVVEVGDRVCITSFALERFSQAAAATELTQIRETAQLIKNLAVVLIGKFMIDTRREDMIALRRADPFNEGCDPARRDQCGR